MKVSQKKISILGATGSVGTTTLDLVRSVNRDASGVSHDGPLNVEVLTANGSWEALASLAKEFRPKQVVIGDEVHFDSLKDALGSVDVEVCGGSEALADAGGVETD